MDSYCLLGEDVSKSLSPVMMNSAFVSLGIDARYAAVSVERAAFQEKFLSLREECRGLNLTMPFKSQVIPLLDQLDPVSRKMGAVNTTKRSGSRHLGFNTDVEGIVVPVRERTGGSGVGRALLLGAGGAARAFCEAMERIGCHDVTVAVRERERGKAFVSEASSTWPGIGFRVQTIDRLPPADPADPDYDLIFNATPVGSRGIPVPESVIRSIGGGEIVFDAVYRPMRTELLKFAELKGCRVIHGYEMLLNQGVPAFEIWTERSAPVEVMREALRRSLEVGN